MKITCDQPSEQILDEHRPQDIVNLLSGGIYPIYHTQNMIPNLNFSKVSCFVSIVFRAGILQRFLLGKLVVKAVRQRLPACLDDVF